MTSLKQFARSGAVFTAFVVLALWVLPVKAMVLDKVAAKVNSEIITLSSIQERAAILMQKYSGAPVDVSEQDVLKEALNMIIDEKLQIQEGKKLGFVIDEDAVNAAVEDIKVKNNIADEQLLAMLEREGRTMESYKNHIRDQILVSKITRFEISNRVKISDKSIVKFYKDNPTQFWQEGEARARHILFIAERGSSEKIRKEKLRLAKKVLRDIRKGGDFAELAMEYSEDISASNGGDVGFVSKGKMVREFEEAVFSLKPGKVSGIVETEYGYHIIKVEEVQKGRTLLLKDVKDQIHQVLAMQMQKEVYDSWMKDLKKTAFIEVTLFDDPAKNMESLSNEVVNKKRKTNPKRKLKAGTRHNPRQQDLQKKWEEMYKSVEKSKPSSKADRNLESLEQSLERIKQLRDQRKITEREYQKRKERLLNRL